MSGSPVSEVEILDTLSLLNARLSEPVWLFDGVAVDFLVGRWTRPHGDIDLNAYADSRERLTEELEAIGFRSADKGWLTHWRRDGRPWRLELVFLERTQDGSAVLVIAPDAPVGVPGRYPMPAGYLDPERYAEQIEKLLGERWRDVAPLTEPERADVLRAAIGYALAEETIGLDRFRQKYLARAGEGADKRAFEIVTAPFAASAPEFAEIAKAIAAIDTLDAFLRDIKARFPEANAAVPAPLRRRPARGRRTTGWSRGVQDRGCSQLVARMERSEIRVSRTQHDSPGFRFAPSGPLAIFGSRESHDDARASSDPNGNAYSLPRAAVRCRLFARAERHSCAAHYTACGRHGGTRRD